MIPNLLLSATPSPGPSESKDPNNSFIGLGKSLIEKSNLTRGQYFLLIMFLVYTAFVLLMAASPAVISVFAIIFGRSLDEIKPPVDMQQLIIGEFIFIGVGLLYFILYAIPEIRDRWKTNRKNNT